MNEFKKDVVVSGYGKPISFKDELYHSVKYMEYKKENKLYNNREARRKEKFKKKLV